MAKLQTKIGYGLGDMSSSMFWKIFTYYLPFFYSNIFGLSLGHAATLMLITKLWDAVSDPMMGILADRTHSKYGKYRPYLLWVSVPFAIAGVLTFTTPAWGENAKLVYAYATYILMMTVYTAINVPYGALLGVITDDTKERTVFSSYRMFFAYGGSFLALALFEPLCKFFKGDTVGLTPEQSVSAEASSWQLAMVVIGLICAVLFFFCFKWTREVVVVNKEAQKQHSIGKDLKALVSNAPWWILLGAAISVLLFNSIRGGAAAYFFQDYVSDQNSLGTLFGMECTLTCGVFLAIGEIANMIGVVMAVPLAKFFGKKYAYIGSMVVCGILSFAFFWIPQGTVTGCWMMLLLQIVISTGAGVTFPLLWSMYADVADYSEYKNGFSSTGLVFSSSSMAQKFGGAFGSALILWLLAAYGYSTVAGAVQSAEALNGLNALMSWMPGIGCLMAAFVVLFYPLTESRMKDIMMELEKRRA